MQNIQIVNGGQTSNALFEAYAQDSKKLEDVLLLVRIIETRSQSVSISIAECTNSQTPIKSRDLRSNDEIQKKLEEAFDGMNIYYERKLKQHANHPKSSRIDALMAGQAQLAYGLDLPEIAKKDRGRIFSDLYDTVFTDDLTADQLLVSYRLLESIETEKKKLQASIRTQEGFDKSKMFLIDGAYHVLFTIGQICDKKGETRFNFLQASSYLQQALELVGETVQYEQAKDESFSFNRFFKEAKTKVKLAARIQSSDI